MTTDKRRGREDAKDGLLVCRAEYGILHDWTNYLEICSKNGIGIEKVLHKSTFS